MNRLLGLVAVASVGSLAFAPACADDAECDDGQRLSDGNCVCKDGYSLVTDREAGTRRCELPSPGTGGSPSTDDSGATGDGSTEDSGSTCSPTVEFGTSCVDGTNHSDCGCPADYCAVNPADGTGYCTVAGCLEDASLCPTGWECFDLSMFQAGLPSICRPID